MRIGRTIVGGLLCLLLINAAAQACTVPVFRYALERWPAAPYVVTVFTQGEPKDEVKESLEAMDKFAAATTAPANLLVSVVDVSKPIENERLRDLYEKHKSAASPLMVVEYPEEDGKEWICWAGPLNYDTVNNLIDSPARRQIARDILSGTSAVWVIVESGDKDKDAAAAKTLDAALRSFEKEFKLPEIDPEDPTSKLRSPLPLNLKFSTVRITKDEVAERMFVQQMTASEQEIPTDKGPLVFAVFGRGRVLPPLVGEEIVTKHIHEFASFLCGACSCEVKTLNPGTDLLIAADWDAILEDRKVEEPARPSIAGKMVAIPKGIQKAAPAANTLAVAPRKSDNTQNPYIVIGGAVAAALVVVTAWFGIKGRKDAA